MAISIFIFLVLNSLCLVSAGDTNQSDQNAEILRKLSDLETKVSVLEEKLESCPSGILNSESDEKIRKRRIVPQGETSQVAFHAYLSKDLTSLGVHQAIHFDKVLLNEGNGYSVHAGEFVAPVPGLYVFSWTIAVGDRMCLKYEVVKNSAVLSYSISDAADHSDWAISSGTAVTRMNANDRVWIRTSNFAVCLHTVKGSGFSTSSFAGFLLH